MSEEMKELIEYRVKPVTRYIVTRFEKHENGTSSIGSVGRGEFDREDVAYEVAYAMAKLDHERKGWPLDDERIQYPRHVTSEEYSVSVAGVLAGARDLAEVALVGRDCAGHLYVAGSLGTPQMLDLFASAPAEIERLREEE